MSSGVLGSLELLLVALLWGATNPALNRASKQSGAPNDSDSAAQKPAAGSRSILRHLANWRFLLPFLLNQAGSVLFLHALSHCAVSLAVPAVNALTMIITAATAAVLGEKQIINKRVLFGMLLILCGVTLCMLSQHWQQQEQAAHEAPIALETTATALPATAAPSS